MFINGKLFYDNTYYSTNNLTSLKNKLFSDDTHLEYKYYFFYEYKNIENIGTFVSNIVKIFQILLPGITAYKYNYDEYNLFKITIFIQHKPTIIIKSAILYLGSKTSLEIKERDMVKREKLSQYYEDLQKRLISMHQLYNIFNINDKNVLTPGNGMQKIFEKFIRDNIRYNINLNLRVYSLEQFVYKFFTCIKQECKLNFTAEHYAKYSYLIKNNWGSTTNAEYQEGKKKYGKKKLHKKTQETLNSNDSFFENCLHYLESNYPKYYNNEDLNIYDIYYGGRVEIFSNRNIDDSSDNIICTLDLSSAYFSFLKEEYPVGNFEVIYNCTTFDKMGFYECEVYDLSTNTPVLPIRHNDKNIYPKGYFKGIWFNEELKLFLEEGGVIISCKKAYVWTNTQHTYKEFYDYIENQEVEDSQKKNKKILKLNFFGYFSKEKKTTIEATYDNEKNEITYDKIKTKSPTNRYVASIITSRCRIKLYKLMSSLRKENTQILYCQTDSVTIYGSKIMMKEIYEKYEKMYTLTKKEHNDVLSITNGCRFFQKEKNEQYTDYYNNTFTIEEIAIIRQKFHWTLADFSINDVNITPSEYTHRLWTNNRFDTRPIIFFQKN